MVGVICPLSASIDTMLAWPSGERGVLFCVPYVLYDRERKHEYYSHARTHASKEIDAVHNYHTGAVRDVCLEWNG